MHSCASLGKMQPHAERNFQKLLLPLPIPFIAWHIPFIMPFMAAIGPHSPPSMPSMPSMLSIMVLIKLENISFISSPPPPAAPSAMASIPSWPPMAGHMNWPLPLPLPNPNPFPLAPLAALILAFFASLVGMLKLLRSMVGPSTGSAWMAARALLQALTVASRLYGDGSPAHARCANIPGKDGSFTLAFQLRSGDCCSSNTTSASVRSRPRICLQTSRSLALLVISSSSPSAPVNVRAFRLLLGSAAMSA
mmetsp:Transcript_43705/g.81213  ORF Transcript_43705/g.81213 Transcript_43705/m.81213 type:complete len:250 (+) Transcript_43705:72-821(+)